MQLSPEISAALADVQTALDQLDDHAERGNDESVGYAKHDETTFDLLQDLHGPVQGLVAAINAEREF